jgi:CRISPR system Cascade subunit CasB
MIKLSARQNEELHDWWLWLQPENQNHGEVKARLAAKFGVFSRAHRSGLKHCTDPSLVLLEPAFHRLLHRLDATADTDNKLQLDPSCFALIAGLLAWVNLEPPKAENGEGTSFAAILGSPKHDSPKQDAADRPLMSRLRFARLQTAGSEEDFYRQARRAIQLADCRADVVKLAEELLAWIREFQGLKPDRPRDRIQVRWATAYYKAALSPIKSPESPTTNPANTGA